MLGLRVDHGQSTRSRDKLHLRRRFLQLLLLFLLLLILVQ